MIGFIGAGQVGTTLGMYFKQKDVTITGYMSRSLQSAQRAATLADSHGYLELIDLIQDSQIIFITTPDDAIAKTVIQLAKHHIDWKDKIICHTSGAKSSALLEPLHHKGATVTSLHPMLSFADVHSALIKLPTTPFTLEGKGPLFGRFKNFIKTKNLQVHTIKTEQKEMYHAAACMVSNYLVTLMDIGHKSLVKAGFDEDLATELIQPLATGTLNNIFNKGYENALTGPMARGDVDTIKAHLQVIGKDDKKLEVIYKTLGLRTLPIVQKQKKLDEYTLEHLKEVLLNEKNYNRDNKENEE